MGQGNAMVWSRERPWYRAGKGHMVQGKVKVT